MLKKILQITILLFLTSTLCSATIVEISTATDKQTYQLGEYVTVFVTAYNPSSEEVLLGFPSGLQASYLMDGVFDWTVGKVFVDIPTGQRIGPYDSFTWNLIHDIPEMELYPLTIGTHTVRGEVVGYGLSAPVEFEVVSEPATLNSNSIIQYGIEYYVQTDKSVYNPGEDVQMLFRVTNLGDEEVTIWCSQVGEFNFWVQKDDETIWALAHHFATVISGVTLAAGEYREIPYVWDMKDDNDNLIDPGIYDVVGVMYNELWNDYNGGSPYATEVAVPITIIPEPATILPIAVAGPNQTVYAYPDGFADVTLNGSDSNDPDGDELTYLWSWVIDGNTYEANSVSPMIELPVEEHIIELVVNDGIVDSEPDYVTITVIEPIEAAKLRIMPRILNRTSRGRYIIAIMRLPKPIAKDQVSDEKVILYPGEIESLRQYVFQSRRRRNPGVNIFAFFDKAELVEAINDNRRVELQVVGNLKTGQYFYGTDSINIIDPKNKPRPNSRRPRRRRR